jgi:PAS domain S-box-containing protein
MDIMPFLPVSKLKEIGAWIVLAGAVVTAVGALHLKLISPSIKAVRSFIKFFEDMKILIPTLQDMASEFKNNHGSSLRDVVDRIENSMIRNRDLGRMLLSSTQTAHFEADANGRCTWVNEAYMDMTGFRFDEFLGYGWYNSIEQEKRMMVGQEWSIAARDGKEFVARYRVYTGDGRLAPVICRAVFSKNEKGAVIGAVGTVALDPSGS